VYYNEQKLCLNFDFPIYKIDLRKLRNKTIVSARKMDVSLRSSISLYKENDLPTCSVGLDLTEEPSEHEGQLTQLMF